MNIFLDTEFTDLSKPRLISLGLVSEDRQEFYRELTDTWTLDQCSLFVIAWVLPLLDDGNTERRLKERLEMHLELVRYLTDSNNQFAKTKVPTLDSAIASQPDLAEHLSFLETSFEQETLRVAQDRFLGERLSALVPEDLLGEGAMPSWQVAEELLAWLGSFDEPTTIHVDHVFDKELLESLLDDWGVALTDRVRVNFFALDNNVSLDTSEVMANFYRSGGRLHHALDDAKSMRLAWMAGKK